MTEIVAQMPSLKNLPRALNSTIRRRKKIAEEISNTREQIAAVRRQIMELEKIKEDLAAIDRALGMHDIQIDPENIRPIQNKYVRLGLPHGELSACIFAAIRANGGGPTSRRSIYAYLCSKHPTLINDAQTEKVLKRSLHHRLKRLGQEGRLKRHHVGSHDGVWSFPAEDDQQVH